MELAQIKISCWRMYDRGLYLISVRTRLDREKNSYEGGDNPSKDAMPQAHAVMDDFGDLVIVRGWL